MKEVTDEQRARANEIEGAFRADSADVQRRANVRHRISKLQRMIIAAIAEHTVNNCAYYPGERNDFAPYTLIRHECRSHWSDSPVLVDWSKKSRTIKVSFSRAVWALIGADLVHGAALAWIWVAREDEHGDSLEMTRLAWQGGGRRRSTRIANGDRPRLKLIGLTQAGWEFVDKERKRAERRQRKMERQKGTQ